MKAAPPRPGFEDDANTPRPRWVGVVLALCVAVLIAGLLMTSLFIMRNYTSTGQGPATEAAGAEVPGALALVQASDCMRCHLPARKAVGPSYRAIAARHADNPEAVALLARKIREGSVGDWGRVIMPRHPQIDEADARLMAQWVLAQRPLPRPAGP